MSNFKHKRVGRNQLVKETSQQLDLHAVDVKPVVDAFLKTMQTHLVDGDSVTLSHSGFGRFDIVKAAPRVGRNVRTGEFLDIPARLRVKFVPGTGLKNIQGKKD